MAIHLKLISSYNFSITPQLHSTFSAIFYAYTNQKKGKKIDFLFQIKVDVRDYGIKVFDVIIALSI